MNLFGPVKSPPLIRQVLASADVEAFTQAYAVLAGEAAAGASRMIPHMSPLPSPLSSPVRGQSVQQW